jgi:hypothetical protein
VRDRAAQYTTLANPGELLQQGGRILRGHVQVLDIGLAQASRPTHLHIALTVQVRTKLHGRDIRSDGLPGSPLPGDELPFRNLGSGGINRIHGGHFCSDGLPCSHLRSDGLHGGDLRSNRLCGGAPRSGQLHGGKPRWSGRPRGLPLQPLLIRCSGGVADTDHDEHLPGLDDDWPA